MTVGDWKNIQLSIKYNLSNNNNYSHLTKYCYETHIVQTVSHVLSYLISPKIDFYS